ncbi:MAG: methionyl-tRNA formyltransferase [Patescibacteria group bacterium]|nr:methionyl-tRNA formyltransferase [Patescibacteria group bacterium]
MTPTPTEVWANDHGIQAFTFQSKANHSILYENEDAVVATLSTINTDLLVSASYGQKIPIHIINNTKHGGLNVHPSLLPRWRGADPIPWQIMSGDQETGTTIVTLTENMDEGKIIAQKKIPLDPHAERESLRRKLFEIGADLLLDILPRYVAGEIKGKEQDSTQATFARRLTRDDGFFEWNIIQNAIQSGKDAQRIERSIRAYYPWPGVWSILPNGKRIKMIQAVIQNNLLIPTLIQIEGKTPQLWNSLNINHA